MNPYTTLEHRVPRVDEFATIGYAEMCAHDVDRSVLRLRCCSGSSAGADVGGFYGRTMDVAMAAERRFANRAEAVATSPTTSNVVGRCVHSGNQCGISASVAPEDHGCPNPRAVAGRVVTDVGAERGMRGCSRSSSSRDALRTRFTRIQKKPTRRNATSAKLKKG